VQGGTAACVDNLLSIVADLLSRREQAATMRNSWTQPRLRFTDWGKPESLRFGSASSRCLCASAGLARRSIQVDHGFAQGSLDETAGSALATDSPECSLRLLVVAPEGRSRSIARHRFRPKFSSNPARKSTTETSIGVPETSSCEEL
jgi:hypothetical protein